MKKSEPSLIGPVDQPEMRISNANCFFVAAKICTKKLKSLKSTKMQKLLNPVVAAKLRRKAIWSAKELKNRQPITIIPWTSPLPPDPIGLELKPYQKESVRFALARNSSYLRLDPGLGKTIVAAKIADMLSSLLVYVCPPFMVRNVAEEFCKWSPDFFPYIIVPDTMLTKDSILRSIKKFTSTFPTATIIVDEAHRFKNSKAKRTKALFSLLPLFTKKIFMSGTPMPNRPIELYPILSHAAPSTIDYMNEFKFGRRYCAGYKGDFGWDFSGASNMKELQQKVIHPSGPFMLSIRKDVLNLPPKIEELFIISANESPKLVRMGDKIGKAYSDVEDLIKQKLSSNLKADQDLHISTYRRLLGQEKVKPSLEYIKTLLEETDENLLIFAAHIDVCGKLFEGLKPYRPSLVTGATPMGVRHKLVKDYQVNKDKRVIIGNYHALGVGFNLTKADRVLMVEYDWTPGVNDQATSRPHRIGRTKSVLVQYITFKDSLDKKVLEALLKKSRAINYI